ncbi:hypothetical protein D3C73_1351200 [compost metagenome]
MDLVEFTPETDIAEVVPRDVAADPLAFGTHHHRAGFELADTAHGVTTACVGEVGRRLFHLELKRERDARSARSCAGLRDQPVEGLFPGRTCRPALLARTHPGGLNSGRLGEELGPDGGVVFGSE